MQYDSDLINGYVIIPPFVGTKPGDKILIFSKDDIMLLFNEKVLSEDYNSAKIEKLISNTNEEDREFARTLGGYMSKCEPIVDEQYRIKLNKELIEQHNLYDGVTFIEDGHHLICKSGKIKKR